LRDEERPSADYADYKDFFSKLSITEPGAKRLRAREKNTLGINQLLSGVQAHRYNSVSEA